MKYFPEKSRFRSGFTLLEILTVVAILAVISALLIPMAKRIKNQARATVCGQQLRQLGVAVNAYMGDHGMKFPDWQPGRESKEDDVPVMETMLTDYVRDEFVFQCPADHEGHFERTGSSYFWNSLVNGQRIGKMNLLGLSNNEAGIPLISDKENFHKHVGHEVNILYADGHVYKELQFIVNQ
ncbi:MAG: type II secretion system protein [Verrucomicrobiales bacterium]|nr:type II secretion system protein [Verrucomicrobiales bacterium]